MTSVFAETKRNLFTTYSVTMQFRDRLLGGVPKDPKMIEGWLRTKAGLVSDSEELRIATLRTLTELGAEVTPDMTLEQAVAASEALAAVKQTQGFKRDESGLYVEDRQVKAMLKEAASVVFPYPEYKWGPSKKTPWKFFAERVFVNPGHITVKRGETNVAEPDGIHMQITHVEDRMGRRSSLGYVEYVERAELSAEIIVVNDLIKAEDWPALWAFAEDNGFGASRSQSFGKFDVIKWERVS